MRRYQKLYENHVIQPTIRVNLAKLGYEAFAFFGIMISSQGILRQVTNKVGKITDIVAVMETTGDYDLTVIGVVRNIGHSFKIGKEIAETSGVKKVAIEVFQLLSPKDTYPPPPWFNLDVST